MLSRPHTDRWFGEVRGQAIAADEGELASLIEEFCARARLENPDPARWYWLLIEPEHRRLFSITLEPAPNGFTVREARIPVGRDKGRIALADAGWPIRKNQSGTPHYTRSFADGEGQPWEVVADIRRAYRLIYGDRAADLSWALTIAPYWTAR